MNRLAIEFRAWVEGNGYGELEGRTGGGHLRYRLRNGSYFTTSSTPSHQHSITNAKGDVRRILGLK